MVICQPAKYLKDLNDAFLDGTDMLEFSTFGHKVGYLKNKQRHQIC